jgi:hypothetical protein
MTHSVFSLTQKRWMIDVRAHFVCVALRATQTGTGRSGLLRFRGGTAVRAQRAVPLEAGWVFIRPWNCEHRSTDGPQAGLCEGDTYGLASVGVFFASFLFRRWKKK